MAIVRTVTASLWPYTSPLTGALPSGQQTTPAPIAGSTPSKRISMTVPRMDVTLPRNFSRAVTRGLQLLAVQRVRPQ